MKTFDELFKEAAKVADRRKMVFNQLIEKTVLDILPKFCEACEKLDIKTVFVKTDNRVISVSENQADECGFFYSVAINVATKEVADAEYQWHDSKYKVNSHFYGFNETEFYRTGIVEFVKTINSRLQSYVEKYENKNIDAEKLI